ncbi:MAG: ParB N-terminal domain-containing protein [Candidatus Hodarchaeaceae archaeon]|nr:ParB N-terminal domain-containing protein [Candidatus Hodarchaeaceae archaeon]
MWFALATPKLELRLRLEELGEVKVHEEIIPELLGALVREVRSDGMARHPVIVDSNTLVVLDGMHRVAALEKLGCRYLPACLVDYRNPHIYVRCWYRTVRGKVTFPELFDAVKSLGLEVEQSSLEGALEALDGREATAAMLTGEGCHMLRGAGEGIRASYAWVGRIERALGEKGLKVGYEAERDARRMVSSGDAAAAIMTPRVRKEEVVEAALEGNPFAHKTTRHVVDARPMAVNVPLEWLTGDRRLEDVNGMLIEHLSGRGVRRLPRGEVFEGRRYEEELWVFE